MICLKQARAAVYILTCKNRFRTPRSIRVQVYRQNAGMGTMPNIHKCMHALRSSCLWSFTMEEATAALWQQVLN